MSPAHRLGEFLAAFFIGPPALIVALAAVAAAWRTGRVGWLYAGVVLSLLPLAYLSLGGGLYPIVAPLGLVAVLAAGLRARRHGVDTAAIVLLASPLVVVVLMLAGWLVRHI